MRGIFFCLFRQKKEAEAKQESMQCLQRERERAEGKVRKCMCLENWKKVACQQ